MSAAVIAFPPRDAGRVLDAAIAAAVDALAQIDCEHFEGQTMDAEDAAMAAAARPFLAKLHDAEDVLDALTYAVAMLARRRSLQVTPW